MSTGGLISGARALWAGLLLLRQPGLRRFVVAPLLINLLIFAGLIWLAAGALDRLLATVLPSTVGWLEYLLWPLFALSALLLGVYGFTLVANLIGAPFNDRLAEKVAERLGYPLTGSSGSSLVGEVSQAVLGELRKWLYFAPLLLAMGLLWVVGLLLAPLALLVPLVWFAMGAWMLGFEYLDYPLSNCERQFARRRDWLRARRIKVLGFGAAALLLTMVPIINFLVMPAAVAGATVLWADEMALTDKPRSDG